MATSFLKILKKPRKSEANKSKDFTNKEDQLEEYQISGEDTKSMGHIVNAEKTSSTKKRDFSLRSGITEDSKTDYSLEYVVIERSEVTGNYMNSSACVIPNSMLTKQAEPKKCLSKSEPASTTLTDPYSSTINKTRQRPEQSTQFLCHSQGSKLPRIAMLPGIFEQKVRSESTQDMTEPLTLTAESLFNEHLVNDGAYTQLFLGTAILSGIGNCPNISSAFRLFLQTVIYMRDKAQESAVSFDESNKCMTSHNVVILGKYPFLNMTWLMSNRVSDDVVICLMSYFARKLKERNADYCELLKFSSECESSQSSISPNKQATQSKIPSEMEEIYSKLEEQWNQLETNKDFQDIISTGVGLVKILNVVKASEAVMDIMPILNKYCKQSFHIVGYNKDFDHATCSSRVLRRFLHGSEKSTHIFLTEIDLVDSEIDITVDHQPISVEHLKSELELENIFMETMDQTDASVEKMKKNLEKTLLELGQPYNTSKSLLVVMFLCSVRTMHSQKKQQLKNDKLFWMSRREIQELYDSYKFPSDDTLDSVLKALMNFGGVLYFYDIIALQEYVILDIVEFVNQIDELYESSELTAKFGLLKYRHDEQYRVIFDILTTLGIATEVKSNQIKCETGDAVILYTAATIYYYIPTIQRLHSSQETQVTSSWSSASSHNFNFSKSFEKSRQTTGNLQAKMCSYLLQKGCFLIPTENSSNTTVRFFNEKTQKLEFDIDFVDDGKELMAHLRNSNCTSDVTHDCQIGEAFNRIMTSVHPFLYKTSEVTTENQIETKNLYKIAKYILEQTPERQESFTTMLGFTDSNWVTEHSMDKKLDAIFDMLDKFNQTHELKQALHEFDEQLHEFLN